MILFLFLGVWRYSFSIHSSSKNEIASLNGTKQAVEGMIKNNPEISQKNQQFVLEVDKTGKKRYFGNLLVFADMYPKLSYGDKLTLDCKLNTPEPIEDFSYDKYLAMKNIFSVCYYPKIETLSNNNGIKILSQIYKIKNNFKKSINQNLGEPSSQIVNAMILGDKKFLSDEIQLKFSKAGLSHIIAISGMHIGVFIIGLGLLFFFFGFSRNISFYLIISFLVFYNILIGFPASALRASFMGILILYAFKIGRLNKIYNSIVLAASMLVLINPMLIRYDLGFIFSFSALLGIVYFYPIISSNFKAVNNKFLKYSRDIIIVSISAQIFILPLIIKNFGVLSLVSPLVNLFVVWTLPFILVGVVSAFILSLIFPVQGFYLFLPVKFLISYILLTVDFFLNIPFSSFELKDISNYYFVFYYLTLFSYIIYRNIIKSKEIPGNKI
jgi:competence protein ComEC